MYMKEESTLFSAVGFLVFIQYTEGNKHLDATKKNWIFFGVICVATQTTLFGKIECVGRQHVVRLISLFLS